MSTSNKKKKHNNTYKQKTVNLKSTSAGPAPKKVTAQATTDNGAKVTKSSTIKDGQKIDQKIVTTNVKNANSNNGEQSANKTYNHAEMKNPNRQGKLSSGKLWAWAIIIIGACILVGVFATILGGDMKGFEAHTLPPLTPPVIVFPIAWAILYVLIGVAGFLVFTSPNQTTETRKGDITWFCINLGLNLIWPLFFYRLDLLILSTILCGLVVISAMITMFRFFYRNLAGGVCYAIYTAWLLYAFYLNLGICLLNA